MAKIFLDPGHGGKDPGALGNGLQEKDIALSLALKIGDILKNHGLALSYSRTKDVFLTLADRASKANNARANLFISIHCNAYGDSSAKGIETYSYPASTKGAKLSKSIHHSIIKSGAYTLNRGIKTKNFAVLRLTNMPAALVELGFITNSQDANILRNKENDLAIAVSKGILSKLDISYNNNYSNSLNLYKVQLGAFNVRSNADALVRELKTKGYKPIIVTS